MGNISENSGLAGNQSVPAEKRVTLGVKKHSISEFSVKITTLVG